MNTISLADWSPANFFKTGAPPPSNELLDVFESMGRAVEQSLMNRRAVLANVQDCWRQATSEAALSQARTHAQMNQTWGMGFYRGPGAMMPGMGMAGMGMTGMPPGLGMPGMMPGMGMAAGLGAGMGMAGMGAYAAPGVGAYAQPTLAPAQPMLGPMSQMAYPNMRTMLG